MLNTNAHLFGVCVFVDDKHHELTGWIQSSLHPAHFIWLVQKTERTGGGAAQESAKSQLKVQKVSRVIAVIGYSA